MKKIKNKNVFIKIKRETARQREELFDDIMLENNKEIKEKLDKIMKIASNNIFDWIEENTSIHFHNKDKININRIYWNKDGKTIEDRLEKYFKIYAISEDIEFLLQKIELLIDTEITNAIYKVPKIGLDKLNLDYYFDITNNGCDMCVSLAEDGVEPPYHPSCQCEGELIIMDDDENEYDIDVEEVYR